MVMLEWSAVDRQAAGDNGNLVVLESCSGWHVAIDYIGTSANRRGRGRPGAVYQKACDRV